MSKQRSVLDEIAAYFRALPSGGHQRVKAARLHTELPSKGRLEKSTPQSRVEKWAESEGLKARVQLETVTEEGKAPKPEFYIFERA